GLLYARRIRTLPLDGTLVVLSACETGAGRLAGGEGVLSLGRAFLQAGASGVVVTHWPVGPATADLMGELHRALADGTPPAEALRRAQLALLAGGHPEPFHWAPFALLAGAGGGALMAGR
ncbi:MAG TPA: CHAT domain-containing protein, partial [Longimicrobiales bacterium]|nr:CHAT domain-containing protein [Longimicrobiales bacterium]